MHQPLSIPLSLCCAVASSACFDDPYGHGGGPLVVADAGDDGVYPPGDRGVHTIVMLETTFIDHPELGHGPLIHIGPAWPKDEFWDGFAWEEAEGSPFGCKVRDRDPAFFLDRGLDTGTIKIDIDLGAAEIPPCKLVSQERGWACNGVSGSGGDIQVVDAEQGIMSLTDPSTTFGDDEVGRLLEIKGAANAANNGGFMVVAAAGDNAIHFKNPAGVAELGTAAEFATYTDRGPAGAPPSISDQAEAKVSLTPTDESDPRFEAFSNEVIGFGDDFVLDDATRNLLTNFPMTGEPVTLGCNGEGGDCGRASASSIVLDTTDAPIDPDSPTLGPEMGIPTPVNKSVQILCIFLTGKATIPAEASRYVAESGATRIRTIFLRADSTDVIQEKQTTTLVAGHGYGGFTDIP